MAQAFKRLERVLKLESDQGFGDRSVVGGIRQFATYWVDQARSDAADEADRVLVEQIAEVLINYDRLPGREARAKAIGDLLERLKVRRGRLDAASPRKGSRPASARPAQPQRTARESQRAQKERKQGKRPSSTQSGEAEHTTTQPLAATAAPAAADMTPEALQQSVTAIKGVGPKIAAYLEKLGATTIGDLLTLFPRRYDDYTLLKPINRLQFGETVTVIGTVWEARSRRTRGNQTMVQAVVGDGTGNIQVTWFNQPWLANKLKPNMPIVLSGTVDQFLGRLVFQNPEWEPVAYEPLRTRRIVPIYPLTQGLSASKMRDIMRTVVTRWADHTPDPLPEAMRARLDLYSLPQAIHQSHFPDNQASLSRARERLVFDELFYLQLGMLSQRQAWRGQPGLPVATDAEALAQFVATLPFALTAAQRRVIDEIAADMADDVPMNRLLQGDVGAGKTVVAAAAMLLAVRAGTQAALMAPTEILAEQHARSLSNMLGAVGIPVRLLIGATPAAEKEAIYAALADGSAPVVVGTHALIQAGVSFHRLGLAVVDEQHRFGVEQRSALRDKGQVNGDGRRRHPHLLVMSATPIPRTLALSLYGDLDLSLLDEMPPGRQEIKTRWLLPRERERAYTFLKREVAAGRQAFVIYPLVEASESIDARAAVPEYENLSRDIFPDLRLGLLHGRLKSADKEAVMRQFYEGDLDVLVATSVIEVGVDVPNASLMIIEGANRFGLAQLHQFRGRVGRGEHQSYCVLVAESGDNGSTEARLAALEQSNDGFYLAEKDLELRGPGEFFGRRQSGLPELRLASLLDINALQRARAEAEALFATDPNLAQPDHALLRERVAQFWAAAADEEE